MKGERNYITQERKQCSRSPYILAQNVTELNILKENNDLFLSSKRRIVKIQAIRHQFHIMFIVMFYYIVKSVLEHENFQDVAGNVAYGYQNENSARHEVSSRFYFELAWQQEQKSCKHIAAIFKMLVIDENVLTLSSNKCNLRGSNK